MNGCCLEGRDGTSRLKVPTLLGNTAVTYDNDNEEVPPYNCGFEGGRNLEYNTLLIA